MEKEIWQFVKKHKGLYILAAIALFLDNTLTVIPTRVVQFLTDSFTSQTLTKNHLILQLGILAGAAIFAYIFAYVWQTIIFKQSAQYKQLLQKNTFYKIIAMRTPYYDLFRSGDMMTRFSTDTDAVVDIVGYGLMSLLFGVGTLLVMFPLMLMISVPITLAAIAPLLVFMYASYQIVQKLERLLEENREAVSQLSNEVLESVEGIRVIRAYGNSKKQADQFQKSTQSLATKTNRIMKYQSMFGPLLSIFFGVDTFIILAMGAWYLSKGQLTIGEILALQLYMVSVVEPCWMMTDFITVYQTGKVSYRKLRELQEVSDGVEKDGKFPIEQFQSFEMRDYRFRYAGSKTYQLDRINVTLQKGQTLGIVGRTGSGKTTFVRQFLRQYPVGTGIFWMNGREVQNYQNQDIERLIGYVPQEHILFSKSVKENILLGKPHASSEELNAAIEAAAFSDDLSRMSNGLETLIGEKGVSISGGQKQRISIARALIRQPELLILDDSLSAVDAKTERTIIENIQTYRQHQTNIIVTHRLSAVQAADWILVFEEGKVIEEGTPSELLDKKGWYYEQYQRQQLQEEV